MKSSPRFGVRLAIIVAASLISCVRAAAAVKLPAVLAHHMVLQRDAAVPIWGWATPGEEVNLAIAGQTKTTTAGADGKWSVKLDKLSAGGPHTLTVTGKNKLTINDVMIDEVWLASGQSNMVHIMPYSSDFATEEPVANYPGLRIFTVARAVNQTPQEDCLGNWTPISPKTVGNVSSVAYHFGRELHQTLGVPVGIITSALGSTPIEAWISLEAQKSRPELRVLLSSWDEKAAAYQPESAKIAYEKDLEAWKEAAAKAKGEGAPAPREPKPPIHPRDQPQHPAVMFNGMIAPLIPCAIRGAIWYQGEHNAQREDSAALYRQQLPLLISDWRTRWGRSDLPFAWVQLPNFDTTTRSPRMTGWPLIRESQLQSLAVPNTGMAVTIDIGDFDSVHPANKRSFGHRLALWARAEVYGEKIPWSGPLFVGSQAQGSAIEVSFRHTDGGLIAKNGDLKGSLIAGADKEWHTAGARIVNERVLVSSPDVKAPVAVRYSWTDNPDGNLCNAAGLPASPFRTDRD